MTFWIRPEPTDEQREALEQVLRAEARAQAAVGSAWRRSGLDFDDETLGGGAPAQQLWSHPGVVEP